MFLPFQTFVVPIRASLLVNHLSPALLLSPGGCHSYLGAAVSAVTPFSATASLNRAFRIASPNPT
jgi:hypothetical protein